MFVTKNRNRFFAMACAIAFVGLTTLYVDGQASSHIVEPLSQCTGAQYDAGTLWIVNSCGVPVTVDLTSDSGNAWGQTDVSPNSRAMMTTMGIGFNPRRDGEVHLFACPQGSEPAMPGGSFWLAQL